MLHFSCMNKKRKNWVGGYTPEAMAFDHWSYLATPGNLIRRRCGNGYEYAVTTGKTHKSICKADVLAVDGAMARRVVWEIRSTTEYQQD